MNRPQRVVPAPSNRLPGDEPVDVPADAADVDDHGGGRLVLRSADDAARIVVGVDQPARADRARTIEIVADGWRFELEVEDQARAALRARATRREEGGATHGATAIRAMIPGRVVGVAAVAGDEVTAGQTLVVVEAMKMQNELPAPRDGRVERVAVSVGDTIDLGDLLVVLA